VYRLLMVNIQVREGLCDDFGGYWLGLEIAISLFKQNRRAHQHRFTSICGLGVSNENHR
jgi:hypothetical protein